MGEKITPVFGSSLLSPPPVFGSTLISPPIEPPLLIGPATNAKPSVEENAIIDPLGRKKRGRPRKYDSEGSMRYIPVVRPPGFGFSPEFSSGKQGRALTPGSGDWQLLASLGGIFADTAGGGFTPYVVTVHTGEDVASTILSFSKKVPRGICILSANGSVSNVTIRQPGSSGGILTYEGRFEILSLSGSFTITHSGSIKSRSGGLSVSLAGPDGRVIGGIIAGFLTAATPIQIVVGSFVPNGLKSDKKKHTPQETPPLMDDKENPNAQNPNAHFSVWNGSGNITGHRPSPDINVSVLAE